jgi:DNA-binding NarL/FixJ family response regulator
MTEEGEHSFKRRDLLVPMRTLIADDVAPIRVMEREIFEEVPDVEVVGEAADVKEAIDLAEAGKPDCLTSYHVLRTSGDLIGATWAREVLKRLTGSETDTV